MPPDKARKANGIEARLAAMHESITNLIIDVRGVRTEVGSIQTSLERHTREERLLWEQLRQSDERITERLERLDNRDNARLTRLEAETVSLVSCHATEAVLAKELDTLKISVTALEERDKTQMKVLLAALGATAVAAVNQVLGLLGIKLQP